MCVISIYFIIFIIDSKTKGVEIINDLRITQIETFSFILLNNV